MAVLQMGMRGGDVKRLQLLLQTAVEGGRTIEADGWFGPLTEAIVKKFQAQRGLKVDGVVGPKTWQALGQLGAATLTPGPPANAEAHWMAIAVAELGVHENSRPGEHTPRIVEYHTSSKNLSGKRVALLDETAWCSSFVNWVLAQAGLKGTQHALASSWLNWSHGEKLAAPRYGAITVIRKKGASSDAATGSTTGNHVAFFVSQSATHLRMLGGNQGDQVRYSNYPLHGYEVRGHLWPLRSAEDPRDLATRLGQSRQ